MANRVDRGERVRTFALADLKEYSRVRNARVREWFGHFIDSPDPDLRAVARRSGGIKPVLPKGWRTTAGMPDGSRVVLSTEIDSHAFPELLKELKRDLGLEFTSDFEPEHVAANLSERKWVLYDVARSRGGPVDLWLRLEDSSTIEIWVVKSAVNRVT